MGILKSLQKCDESVITKRMLENIAFFSIQNKKIVNALKLALEGKNQRYKLLFSPQDINIIDLVNKKYLYPKNTFLSISYNLALNPLNNDKWSIYANNLKLAKIEGDRLKITTNAINQMVDYTYKQNLAQNLALIESSSINFDKSNANQSNTLNLQNPKTLNLDFTLLDLKISLANNAESSKKVESKNNIADSTFSHTDSNVLKKLESREFENLAFLKHTKQKQEQPKLEEIEQVWQVEQDLLGQAAQAKSLGQFHLPYLFLPQVNIFGLFGGLFLELLVESGYKFHSLLIYEEDLELFAISCYFIDFRKLFLATKEKSCYIFIENMLDKALLNHYFYSKKVTNNFLRLTLNIFQSPKIEQMKNFVSEAYKVNSRGWGSFEDEIIGLKNTLKNIKESKILQFKNKLDIPICVVGSGPSLESNLEFISKNQNKMLIFSCGTALKILKKHNIKIDFQIEIERTDYLSSVLEESNLGYTPLLCASLVDNKIIKLAKTSLLFLRGGSASSYIFDSKVVEFCSPFVGNAGFSLACNLSDTIILCGMDCGYIKGKSKHSSGSYYGDEVIEIPNDCFKVASNCTFEVYSNSIFSLSRESFELALKFYKPKNVYNLSFGARIEGAKFIQSLEIPNFNKDDFQNKLFKNALSLAPRANLINGIKKYINNLALMLECDIKSKQELFSFIDKISAFLAQNSFKIPHIAILFEGSLSHLLQNMLICAICIKSNDIQMHCKAYLDIIQKALRDFEKECEELNII